MNEEDFSKIIHEKLKTDDFVIQKIRQDSCQKTGGFFSENSFLEIDILYNKTEETHNFFVKSLPKTPTMRKYILEMNVFFKEKQFFKKYLQILKQHCINLLDDILPKCFLITEENMVFENLNYQSFETLSSRQPLQTIYLKAALRAVAKLHASSLILEEKNFKFFHEFKEELSEAYYTDKDLPNRSMEAYKRGIEALIDLTYDDTLQTLKDFKFKILQGCKLQKDFVKPSTKFRNTLCHGDLWTKNLMFDQKNTFCKILDFQLYRYCPPGQDVLACIYLTTDRSFRRSHLDEMLRFYYEELDTIMKNFGLENVISEEEFLQSCQHYQQFVLIQTLMYYQDILVSEELARELLSTPEKEEFVMLIDKYGFMVEIYQKDSVVRKMTFEVIEELRDFYENQK